MVLPRVLTNGTSYWFKVSHTQGDATSESTSVAATPTDPGGANSPLAVSYDQVYGGVVGPDDTDSYEVTYAGVGRTVCYVRSPAGHASIRLGADDGWSSSFDKAFATYYRLVQNEDGTSSRRFDLESGTGDDGEYEILCRNTQSVNTRDTAVLLDVNFPADIEWTEKDDAFWFTFFIEEAGSYIVGTHGVLDTRVRLYDSEGTELVANDDGTSSAM